MKVNGTSVINLIGVASDNGATTSGSSDGPKMLRARGLVHRVQSLGFQVVDSGDVSPSSTLMAMPKLSSAEQQCKHALAVFNVCQQLSSRVEEALLSDQFPLIVGGDHSLSIGSVAGASNFFSDRGQKIGLIWVDAHADFNTPSTSPTKFMFGMPVSCLTGGFVGALSGLQKNSPAVKPENVAMIGLRDIDPGERSLLKSSAVNTFTMKDVDIEGIATVTEKAIEKAAKDTDAIFVSFDLDVCDPFEAPATGTPRRGGLSFREAHCLLELLSDCKKICALEVVEYNPRLDSNHQTADTTLSFIESGLGASIL